MNDQRLVTLTGPVQDQYMDLVKANQDFKKLSDFDAGIVTLQAIGEYFPGLTWDDFRPEFWPLTKKLINKEARKFKMSGCSDCSGCSMSGKCRWWAPQNCALNLVSDIKDTVVDAVNWIGDSGGDVIRLVTDEDVLDGASRIVTGVATGGTSELLNSLISGLGGKSKDDIDSSGWGADLISGVPNEYLAMGGAGLFVVILLMVAMR